MISLASESINNNGIKCINCGNPIITQLPIPLGIDIQDMIDENDLLNFGHDIPYLCSICNEMFENGFIISIHYVITEDTF